MMQCVRTVEKPGAKKRARPESIVSGAAGRTAAGGGSSSGICGHGRSQGVHAGGRGRPQGRDSSEREGQKRSAQDTNSILRHARGRQIRHRVVLRTVRRVRADDLRAGTISIFACCSSLLFCTACQTCSKTVCSLTIRMMLHALLCTVIWDGRTSCRFARVGSPPPTIHCVCYDHPGRRPCGNRPGLFCFHGRRPFHGHDHRPRAV